MASGSCFVAPRLGHGLAFNSELDAYFLDLELSGQRINVYYAGSKLLLSFLKELQMLDSLCYGHNYQPKFQTKRKILLITRECW
jgi:predicted phosphodiesterase